MFFESNNNTKLYDILELDKNCSQTDIKSSYKKLARKYHPDRNKGNKEFEEKFKEISRAYTVLSNSEKRSVYDKFGEEGLNSNNNMPDMNDMDPFNLFGNFFNRGNENRKTKSRDRIEEINVSLKDIYMNKVLKISFNRNIICETCSGTGVKNLDNVKRCMTCKGTGKILKIVQLGPGIVHQTEMICNSCNGKGTIYDNDNLCIACDGKKTVTKKTSLKIKLSRSTRTGDTFMFEGQSDQVPGVDIYGDFIVKINIREHSIFSFYNVNDLLMKKDIILSNALCGLKFMIEHLDGRKLLVEYDDVIHPGSKKLIKGEGMDNGDLFIEFNVIFPKKIDNERKSYIKKLLEVYDISEDIDNSENVTKCILKNVEENSLPDDNINSNENVECIHQ